MKLEDFKKAAELTRLSAEGRQMAKLHLVDGLSLEEAGREVLGITYKADGVTPMPMRWRAHKAVLSVKNAMSGTKPVPTVSLNRIAAEEFEKLAEQTELGQDARDMARRYLVDGMTMDEAGQPYGADKRRVHQVVRSIRKAFAKGPGSETATVKSSVDLPAGLVGALQHLGEAIRSCPSPSRRDETVHVVTEAVKKATKDLG